MVRQLLKIEWQYADEQAAPAKWEPGRGPQPPSDRVDELLALGQLGYIRAIQVKLDEIGADHPEHSDFVSEMRTLVDRFDLDRYMATLKTLQSHDR
jgi:hypothetical protein